MDWFSWLSKTNLDLSLTNEYAVAFAHNELEQDDISYFNHEFLQSMGISIAKHRLEILKLATTWDEKKNKNERRAIIRRPVLWFKYAIKQTKSYLAKQIETFVHHHHRENSSPLSLVPGPERNHSLRWKVAMLQRNKRLKTTPLARSSWPIVLGNDDDSTMFMSCNNGIMMLANVSPTGGNSRSSGSTQSSGWAESEANAESANPWNSSFSSSTEEIKWDSMFKNLKPT